MQGLLSGYSQYLVMIGKVFHPAELFPVLVIHNESYTISAQKNLHVLNVTFEELHLFLLEDLLLPLRHMFLCSALVGVCKGVLIIGLI